MLKSVVLLFLVCQIGASSLDGCHFHGETYYCVDSAGEEGYVTPAPASTGAPESYTSCHNHGTETHCKNGDDSVYFVKESEDEDHHSHDHSHDDDSHSHDHHHTGVSSGHIENVSGSVSSAMASASTTAIAASVSASGTASPAKHGNASGASVTGCHLHGETLFCVDSASNEGYITPAPSSAPLSLTGCHAHGSATYCLDSSNDEFQFVLEDDDHHSSEVSGSASLSSRALSSRSLSSESLASESGSLASEANAANRMHIGAAMLMPLLGLF